MLFWLRLQLQVQKTVTEKENCRLFANILETAHKIAEHFYLIISAQH